MSLSLPVLQDGLPAKIKGTPIRLNLKLPEAQSAQHTRAPTPTLSPRMSTDQSSSSPSHTSSAPTHASSAPGHTPSTHAGAPQRPHAPSPLAQSHTAASVNDSPSPALHSAVGMHHTYLSPSHPIYHSPRLPSPISSSMTYGFTGRGEDEEEEEIDYEQTVVLKHWHSFEIEARTKHRGTPSPKKAASDLFNVTITGPNVCGRERAREE